MQIKFRLSLSYVVLLVFLAATVLVAVLRLQTLASNSQMLVEQDSRRSQLTSSINTHAESAAGRLLLLFLLEQRNQRIEMYKEIDRHNALINEALVELEPLMLLPEDKSALAKLNGLRNQFDQHFTETVEALEFGEYERATQLMSGDTHQSLKAMLAATEAMAERQQLLMQQRQNSALELVFSSISLVLILGACALVVGAFMAWYITRSIITPLNHAVDSTTSIAQGDLAQSVAKGGRDEFGTLLNGMTNMRERLREVIGSINQSSDKVSDAASALQSASVNVKAESSEQSELAHAIESSVASFSQGIGLLATNVQTSRDEASKARDMAQQGAEEIVSVSAEIAAIAATVEKSAHTVSRLGQSVQEVTGTVGVIREIADQTNLLALNASIEAARAGESGRGFAVVADEVRVLATRTAEATGQIDDVISRISTQASESIVEIENGKKGMERGTELIRGIIEPLEELRDGAQHSLESLDNLNSVVSDQVRESQSIATHVATIVVKAKANQDAAIEVADITETLGDTSKQLQSSIASFRT